MSHPAGFERLTVIGFGLIGGSFAMAAREMCPDLWIQAVDPDSKTLTYAISSEVVDKVSLTLPESFEENHLVVLATHLSDSLEILKDLAPRVAGKDILVSDVGSCKRAICALGETLLPRQFVGGHPMAGKEFSGVRQATSLLFAGKTFFVCPPADFPEETLSRLEEALRAFRMVPRRIDPETHDRYMAYMSHLPQLYSIVLTNLIHAHEPARMLPLHGGGIDDQLRLAASPYPMWRDVFIQNQDNLRMVLRELTGLLQQADGDLDTDAMVSWFERSNFLHQEFQEYKQSLVR